MIYFRECVFLVNWQDKPVGSHEDKITEKRKAVSHHVLDPGLHLPLHPKLEPNKSPVLLEKSNFV